MSRILTNKHINNTEATRQDFYDGINVENPEERKRIAMGRIILVNRNGSESIWMLNENDEPKLVAEPSSTEIPSYIREYIASAMTAANVYTDNAVESGISEYNTLVIESADTIYNELMELSAYTMNLKNSNHFMLTETEYSKLKAFNELIVNDENFSKETIRLNSLVWGSVVTYSDSIFYCIYDNGGGGGGDIDISGSTIYIDSLEIEDEHTLILNDDLTIDEENNTITIN